ncbi:MAG: MBOAT family protein, partial [Anaerolineae bacterium]|nr:MBOAT family protein [Anaerolineae bacterium]
GLFKKFVIADTLARMALSPLLVNQMSAATSPVSVWLMLYAFTFQIYFDFSGYTDIAIGIGKLAEITLPENFNRPYTRRNITVFWNNWHITLSTWFRNYFFTPFSRFLMQTPLKSRRLTIIFVAQVCTMVLIGLWHGANINFILWGLWHGVGLWFHKWLTDHTRSWDEYVQARPRLAKTVEVLSILTTFHFVALGWLFFALPDLRLIIKALGGLIGIVGN